MRNPTRFILPAAAALGLTIAAAITFARGEPAAELSVTAAWAAASPAKVAAAYLTIENRGDTDAALVAASSPSARTVTAHESKERDGVATMRPIERLVVPAGGALAMAPGGTHLMLSGLAAPLKQGDRLEIKLVFRPGGELTVPIEVRPIGRAAPAHAGHEM